MSSRAWTSIAIAGLTALCAVPFLAILALAVGALRTEQIAVFPGLVTVALTICAAFAATLIGGLLGACLLGIPQRVRLLALGVLALPALLPNYVLAIAWSGIWLAEFSIGQGEARLSQPAIFATLWVWIATLYPWAMGLVYLALRLWTPSLREIAYASGLKPARERRLRYRLLWAPLAVAFVISWLIAISDFAVPDYFRLPLYATHVFVQVSSYLNPAGAARMGLPILALTCVLGLALTRFSRAYRWQESARDVTPRNSPRYPSLLASLIVLAAVMVWVAMPLGSLIHLTGSTAALAAAWNVFFDDAGASLALAGLSLLLAFTVGSAVGYALARRPVAAGWIRGLPLLTFALPSSLLGLAIISLTNQPGAIGLLYTSGGALVIALVVKYIVILVESSRVQFASVAPALEEIAAANGGRPWRTSCRITLPLAARGLVFGAGVFALFTMNDLTLPALTAPPGVSTLPLTLFSTVHYGPASLLAALCLWHAGLALCLWIVLCACAVSLEPRRA